MAKRRTRTSSTAPIEGGSAARLQLALLRSYACLTRRLDHRGMQRLSWTLGNWFAEGNSAVVEHNGAKLRLHLNDGYWTKLLIPGVHYELDVERWSISPSSFGIDAQLATIAVSSPIPLKPFHTRGRMLTRQ